MQRLSAVTEHISDPSLLLPRRHWNGENVGDNVEQQNSSRRRTQPSCKVTSPAAAGVSTPPLRMPETPSSVQQLDIDYAITVHQLESKEWDMWELLSSHGLTVDSPETNTLPKEKPQHRFPISSKHADSEIFDLDM
jgi:hypothetical protein